MAAGNVTLYSKNKNVLKLSDLTGATVKLLLTTSSYTPDATVTGNSVLTDISNELANANGYTTGGIALSSMSVTSITGGYKFTSANPVWTASGGSIPAWRNGVLYVSGSLWSLTSPLIGYFVGDTTSGGTDIPATTSGNTLTITVPSGGWFDET